MGVRDGVAGAPDEDDPLPVYIGMYIYVFYILSQVHICRSQMEVEGILLNLTTHLFLF